MYINYWYFNRRGIKAEGEDEECDKETYLNQGKYELQKGDAKRALYYFDRCADAYNLLINQTNPVLYTLRSQANCMLGNYQGKVCFLKSRLGKFGSSKKSQILSNWNQWAGQFL